MTTDTKALTERIAEALFEVRDDAYDLDEWEDLDSTDRERWMCDAAAVLPIVEAEVRKAQAEAWDEGCEAFEAAHKCDHIEPWGHLRDNPYRATETGDQR